VRAITGKTECDATANFSDRAAGSAGNSRIDYTN